MSPSASSVLDLLTAMCIFIVQLSRGICEKAKLLLGIYLSDTLYVWHFADDSIFMKQSQK